MVFILPLVALMCSAVTVAKMLQGDPPEPAAPGEKRGSGTHGKHVMPNKKRGRGRKKARGAGLHQTRKHSNSGTREGAQTVQPSEPRPYAYDQKTHVYASDYWVQKVLEEQKLDGIESVIDELPDEDAGALLKKLAETGLFSEAQKRDMIAGYFINVLDMPLESEWDGYDGTVSIIIDQLHIPQGSTRSVRAVLEGVSAAADSGEQYSPARNAGAGGHNQMIADGSEAALHIADSMERGEGIHQAFLSVNEHLAAAGGTHVGKSAVRSAFKRAQPVITPIGVTKQGNRNPGSAWAVARKGWVIQLMLMLGVAFALLQPLEIKEGQQLFRMTGEDGQPLPHFDISRIGTINLHQVVFWDETHKKCVIGGQGHSSRGADSYCRFYRCPVTKALLAEVDGGELAPEKPELHVKYAKETRLSLGVAKVKQPDGQFVGKNCLPYNYTGCWLHTITDYERLVQDEVKAAVDSTSDDGRSPWIENQRKTEDLFEEDPLTELKNIAGVKAKTLNDAGLLTVADLKVKTRDAVKALAKASKGIGEEKLLEAHEHSQSAQPGNDAALHKDYRRVGGVVGALKSANPWAEKFPGVDADGKELWRAAVAKSLRGAENRDGGGASASRR